MYLPLYFLNWCTKLNCSAVVETVTLQHALLLYSMLCYCLEWWTYMPEFPSWRPRVIFIQCGIFQFLMWTKINHSLKSMHECTFTVFQVVLVNKVLWCHWTYYVTPTKKSKSVDQWYLWAFSLELALCHPPGTKTLRCLLDFLKVFPSMI